MDSNATCSIIWRSVTGDRTKSTFEPESDGVLAGHFVFPKGEVVGTTAMIRVPLAGSAPYYQLVTNAPDALLLILELLTWIGLIPGLVMAIVGFTRRALSRRYEETWGIVVDGPPGDNRPHLRWMDLSRTLRLTPLDDDDGGIRVGDELPVYSDRLNSRPIRLDPPSSDGKAFVVVGLVLLGVGAAAGITQIVLMFLE